MFGAIAIADAPEDQNSIGSIQLFSSHPQDLHERILCKHSFARHSGRASRVIWLMRGMGSPLEPCLLSTEQEVRASPSAAVMARKQSDEPTNDKSSPRYESIS